MKNKKAMEVQFSQVLTIFLAVAILSIIVIALYPKIKNLPREGLAALGLVEDKCEHSGLTAEDYSEKITSALYNTQVNLAISYFKEFKDKCDFDISDLSIGGGQGREKSIFLANTLCERGDFIYSREIYEAIPSDDKGDLAETCIQLAEVEVLLSRQKYDKAKELIEDGLFINEESPDNWKTTIAEVYMSLEEYSPAYEIYYSMHELYETESNPLTGIFSQSSVLVNLNNINNIVLTKKFVSSEEDFCFKFPDYISTISSSTIIEYAENNLDTELSLNIFGDIEESKSYSCAYNQDHWFCTITQTCSIEIIDLET